MLQKETMSSCDLRAVMSAMVAFLHDSWPTAVNVTPRQLGVIASDRDFLEAALALQDEGAIMYEALLVGVGARPCLRDVMLTRKGQLWSAASA